MKILECFAGTRSIGKVADEKGLTVFSVDNNKKLDNIDLYIDIDELTVKHLPFIPDVAWFSTICTPFSIAGWFHHWDLIKKPKNKFIPKSKTAFKGISLAKSTLRIINELLLINPNMKFYIENPRGLLRKMSFMILDKNIKRRVTITYCQYGFDFMKPTDIWTNDMTWTPRKMCKAGDSCHVSSPKSSDMLKNMTTYYERSAIPYELCNEILEHNLKGCLPQPIGLFI